jgi:hypothetical protein
MSDDRQHEHVESFEPDTIEEDGGDPAAAFDALWGRLENLAADLAREMTTIRKGVEHALDHLDQRGDPIDYSGEIGRMSQDVAGMSERLAGIEQSPILKQGPEHYARMLERGGEGLVRTAAQRFQNESRDFQRVARELAGHTRGARTRRQQGVNIFLTEALHEVPASSCERREVVGRLAPFRDCEPTSFDRSGTPRSADRRDYLGVTHPQ